MGAFLLWKHSAPKDTKEQLTEQLDVDLLQRVDTAELVQLVVDLVEDESFVIVSGVVLHYVVHCKRRERR